MVDESRLHRRLGAASARGLGSAAAPGFVAAFLGVVVRVSLVLGRAPGWRPDSESFLTLSRLPLADADRWVGPRTPLVPLLLDLTGGRPGTAFLYLQVVVAAVCWGLLASEVSRFATTPLRSWSIAGLVLLFSLTTPIVQWDRMILTESWTLALLAASIALLLRYLRTRRPAALILLVPVLVVWAAARDTIALVLVGGGVVAIGAWAVGIHRRRRSRGEDPADDPDPAIHHRFLVPAIAVTAVLIGGLALVGAGAGERDRSPLANVFAVRVLPYPERVDWFADHGMPEADRFRKARESMKVVDGEAPRIGISRTDPTMDRWWTWLAGDGKATFLRFVLTHPTYALTEPFERPERAIHSGGGHTGSNFREPDLRTVPVIDVVWRPSNLAVLAVLAGAGVWWMVRGRRRHPLVSVAALTTGLGLVYWLAAWHGDGLEAARHVFVGGAAFRVAVLLVIARMLVGSIDVFDRADEVDPGVDGMLVGTRRSA